MTERPRTPSTMWPSTVGLWFADLTELGPALASLDQRHALMPDIELQRLDLRRQGAAVPGEVLALQRYGAHVLLRYLLSRHIGLLAAALPFARAPSGKPGPIDGDLDFSLSHTGSLVLIGLSRGAAIGVDIQTSRAIRMTPARAATLIAAGQALLGMPDAMTPGDTIDNATFLQAWTALEAVAKLRGGGLGRFLADLGLSGQGWRDASRAATQARASATNRTIRALAVKPSVFAAVAVDALGVEISTPRTINPSELTAALA